MSESIQENANATVTADGYVVGEGGEIIDVVKPDVEGRELCEWVLSKRMEAEAEIAALEMKKAAYERNLERQISEQRQRLGGLSFRFDAVLADYAREVLKQTGQKTRTVKFDNGAVSFRSSAGTSKICNMAKAVEWAEAHCPSIVKIEKSVALTDVRAWYDAQMSAYESGEASHVAVEPSPIALFIESSGPKETVSITTGIKKGSSEENDR